MYITHGSLQLTVITAVLLSAAERLIHTPVKNTFCCAPVNGLMLWLFILVACCSYFLLELEGTHRV